jgi:hypothetical protein
MEEREIQLEMKRIQKITDEAKRRLLKLKEKKTIKKENPKKMGTISSKIKPKETMIPKPKLYCKIITNKGIQCSKYQIEGCNNMCKQHYDNFTKDIVMKIPTVSKKSEDPKNFPLPTFTAYQKPVPMEVEEESKKIRNKVLKKKEPIPAAIKTLVWNKWVGDKVAEAGCYCCKVTSISMRHFHCGHFVSEKNGGKCTIDNLRPICANCNLSMSSMNMNEFIEKFGLHK